MSIPHQWSFAAIRTYLMYINLTVANEISKGRNKNAKKTVETLHISIAALKIETENIVNNPCNGTHNSQTCIFVRLRARARETEFCADFIDHVEAQIYDNFNANTRRQAGTTLIHYKFAFKNYIKNRLIFKIPWHDCTKMKNEQTQHSVHYRQNTVQLYPCIEFRI